MARDIWEGGSFVSWVRGGVLRILLTYFVVVRKRRPVIVKYMVDVIELC
jgi:hypothetical protein